MKQILKTIFIFIVIIIFLLGFNTSYSELNINNIVIVVALGIDTSTENNMKVSFQFTNVSSVSQDGSSEQSPSVIYTIDASSVSSAINLMNSYLGKELNLSHCKLIVFSEEFAQNGITDEIYTFINSPQIRPSTNIVISKCSSKYYLENSKPLFENLLTKYYEIFPNSSKSTGYTANVSIGDFFRSLVCDSCEAYAILGGLSNEDTPSNTSINSQKESSSKSSESSLNSSSYAENIGLAVFKDDKLVGELNAIETLAFLATKNNLNGFLISVPNPEKEGEYIDIHITTISSTKSTVKIVNGTPYIKLKYQFSGRVSSMQKDEDLLNADSLERISQSCNSYLEGVFLNYLYKTSKILNSDINDFGRPARSSFLTTTDFKSYNWNEKYKDSFFDVDVDTSVKSSLILTDT